MRFLDNPIARTFGGCCLALVIWVMTLSSFGVAGALATSLAIGALAAMFFPDIVISRISWAVPMIAALVLFSITLMFMAPGDPFSSEKAKSEAVKQAQKQKYGLGDDPNAVQFYGAYMKGLLTEGYLGPSMSWQGRDVTDLLLKALPVSLSLGLLALIIAVALGLLLGMRAGYKPNSATDYTSMGLALIGISLPNFVLGAALILVFSLSLGWLPVAGWGGFRHLVLPALTLALPYAAYIARLARSGTIEVMNEDYIRTARAKGLPESEVVMKHAFRQSITPVVSFLGPGTANLFTGSFVVEVLFNVPGMGQYFVKGALNRDYYVVLGTVLIYVVLIIIFNLIVDLAYAWLDPRVKEHA